MADNITHGLDGEIRASDTTSAWELNYHPDTPDYVELGYYGFGGSDYETRAYFNVEDLRALLARIAEED